MKAVNEKHIKWKFALLQNPAKEKLMNGRLELLTSKKMPMLEVNILHPNAYLAS